MLQRTLHTNRGNANGEEFPSWNPRPRLARPRLHVFPSANFVRPEHASCGAYDKKLLFAPPHSALLERFRADRVRAQQLHVWGAGEHVERLRVRAM